MEFVKFESLQLFLDAVKRSAGSKPAVINETLALQPDYTARHHVSAEKVVLPERLEIYGNLHLAALSQLHALPEELVVHGNCDVSRCKNLTALPEKFHVDGNLNIEQCTALESLPESMQVGGYCIAKGCTSLKTIHDNITIGSHLMLPDCTSLITIPSTLTVSDAIVLMNCTSLTHLPYGLQIHNNLRMQGCTNLRYLPEKLTISGNLEIQECNALDELPAKLDVRGKITLRGCPKITLIPKDTHARLINATHQILSLSTNIQELEKSEYVHDISACITVEALVTELRSEALLGHSEIVTALQEYLVSHLGITETPELITLASEAKNALISDQLMSCVRKISKLTPVATTNTRRATSI